MRYCYPVLLLACLSWAACKKKEVTGPQGPVGPAGPAYKGVVTGHVGMYDQYGSRMVFNYTPLQVTLSGYDTVMTDSLGYFHFDSVATGNYKLTVNAAEFGSTVVRNVNVIKDTTYQPVKVSQKPQFDITALTATKLEATAEVQITLTFPIEGRVRNVLLLIGKTADVSGDPSTYLLSYVKTIPASSFGTFTTRIPVSDLNNARIFYGDVVHIAAYSYVVSDMSTYEDPITGRNVYTAIGQRVVDTCMAP